VRIALDARWLRDARIDGIGRVVAELTPELVKSDRHEFVVLYHEEWTRTRLEERLDGACSWARLDYPVLSSADIVRLPADIRGLAVDTLYAFNYPTSPLHRGYRVVASVNDVIPFVFGDRGSGETLRWRAFYATKLPMRLLLRAFADVHVPSTKTARDLVRLFPEAAPKIAVVPYGVAPPRPLSQREVDDALRALGLAPGYVLYVGRYESYKNVPSLVQAHAALAAGVRQRHPLVLVGHAPSALRDRLSSGDVVWTGALEDLEAVYRGAALFVYPSLYEGFGLPPLEAMARGVAVVTTHHGSLPEVLGEDAVLTDGGASALSAAIAELLADPTRRSHLGERGRCRAQRFRWEETARRLLDDVFVGAAAQSRPHPVARRR
jgi:glycosyltransferase involved in cell wall biosynthesis